MISNRDSQFQQQMLLEQAGIDTSLGQETLAAGTISGIGTAIGGLTKAYGAMNPPTAPTSTGTQQFGAQPGV